MPEDSLTATCTGDPSTAGYALGVHTPDQEAKGTSYSGIWTGQSVVVPAIPFMAAGDW